MAFDMKNFFDEEGDLYEDDVKFTFFDELDLAFSKVLKLLDTPLFIFLLHMLLTVVITSIVLYLLMTVVSSFNIYMTARAFYQSPHTSWTLIGRYLTCMDTDFGIAQKYFKERDMFLTRAKYNDLVEKFQKKMLRLKVKCHTPFEFKTKLNYLFAQTEIRFNRHAEIQRVLKVIKLEYSKPTCPEDTDSQDDLFVVAVQEIDQNSETKSDKVNDQLVNWANHCQVVHQQFLMAGSPSGSDTTDRTIKSNDPSQPTDSMTSRSFDSNSSWTSKTNTNEHHRKDR